MGVGEAACMLLPRYVLVPPWLLSLSIGCDPFPPGPPLYPASVPDQIFAAKVERRMALSPAAEQAVDRGHSSALRVPRLHLPCAAAASCMLVLLRLASGVWRLASALTSVSLLAAAERRCQWAVPPISHGGTQHVRHTMVCKSRRRRFSV